MIVQQEHFYCPGRQSKLWTLVQDFQYTLMHEVLFFKGRSSRKIQEEFPQLSKKYWGKHFWGIGYAAFSSGHVTDEMIQNYLKNHKNDPNHNDDDFKVE